MCVLSKREIKNPNITLTPSPPPTPRLSQTLKFARREDAFRRREETLRKQDLELQESLIKFNKFLQENER